MDSSQDVYYDSLEEDNVSVDSIEHVTALNQDKNVINNYCGRMKKKNEPNRPTYRPRTAMHTDKILEDTVGPLHHQSKSFNQNTETINMSAEIKPKVEQSQILQIPFVKTNKIVVDTVNLLTKADIALSGLNRKIDKYFKINIQTAVENVQGSLWKTSSHKNTDAIHDQINYFAHFPYESNKKVLGKLNPTHMKHNENNIIILSDDCDHSTNNSKKKLNYLVKQNINCDEYKYIQSPHENSASLKCTRDRMIENDINVIKSNKYSLGYNQNKPQEPKQQTHIRENIVLRSKTCPVNTVYPEINISKVKQPKSQSCLAKDKTLIGTFQSSSTLLTQLEGDLSSTTDTKKSVVLGPCKYCKSGSRICANNRTCKYLGHCDSSTTCPLPSKKRISAKLNTMTFGDHSNKICSSPQSVSCCSRITEKSRSALKSFISLPVRNYPSSRKEVKPKKASSTIIYKPPLPHNLKNNSSYLQRYREKNYGSILAKERKSPEGSACSTFGDSKVESLSDLGACESIEGDSSGDDEEEDFFYRNVMEKSSSPTTNQCFLRNNFAPQEEKWKNKEQPVCHGKLKNIFSDEDTTSQLKSVSEQYIPLAGQYKAYTLQDYKRQINVNLGGLGPDITANNEKMKLMMKQRRYGEKANLRNIKKLKESQLRKEKNCKSSSLYKLSPKNLEPLNFNPLISRRKQPVEASSTVPTIENQRDAKDKNRYNEEGSSLVNSVSSLSKAQGKSVRSRRRKCISKKLQTEDKIVDSDVETRTLLNSLQDRHMKEVQLVESIINDLS